MRRSKQLWDDIQKWRKAKNMRIYQTLEALDINKPTYYRIRDLKADEDIIRHVREKMSADVEAMEVDGLVKLILRPHIYAALQEKAYKHNMRTASLCEEIIEFYVMRELERAS